MNHFQCHKDEYHRDYSFRKESDFDRFYLPVSVEATYFCQGGWKESLQLSQLMSHNDRYRYSSSAAARGYNRYSKSSLDPRFTSELSSVNITRGFLIAKPSRRDSKSQRRVCLIYIIVDNTSNSNNTINNNSSSSVSYWWTVGKHGCQRNIIPGMSQYYNCSRLR